MGNVKSGESTTFLPSFHFRVSSIPMLIYSIFIAAVMLASACEAGAGDGKGTFYPQISLSSHSIPQGDLVLIKVRVKRGEKPRVTWMDREIYMVSGERNADWYGFVGVDLKSAPKPSPLRVRMVPSGLARDVEIRIKKKDYGVRRLTLPKEMVDLDAQALERVEREAAIMKAVMDEPDSSPLWRGPFLRPFDGEIVGIFGRRSIINEQPRSPHSGVDLKGERGTPVRVINRGKVALTCEHFFSGLSVVIDHGGGVKSMYFHLDKITVQRDQVVKKGEVIGYVGATGRATGPHLHFGVRVNGARVDPLRLIDLSAQME
jgi:murein DD-endopeptidase MepM/ murein hydrolase activator NlpD